MLSAQKLKPLFLKKFQAGQGIIEIIVVIGIASIIILALVALSVRSGSTAKNSSTHDQATRLAQQGLDILKSAIKQNASSSNQVIQYFPCANSSVTPQFFSWSDFYNLVNVDDEHASGDCYNSGGNWSYIDPTYGREGVLHAPGDCGVCTEYEFHIAWDSNDWFRVRALTGGTTFYRRIFIADTPTGSGGKSHCNYTATDYQQVKQFTVSVEWTDNTGLHNSVVTQCVSLI